jgi:DNA-binding transcriptional regulator YhcF (GntR family)
VDRAYDLPLGIQLAWKLRALIAGGRIAAGEQLPSVREMAKQAGVNVNTVRSVYSRLENDGFLVTHHGRGTFAAEPPPSAADVEGLASAAVADARAEGLDPRDLATAIYAAAAVPDDAVPGEESGEPARDRGGDDDFPDGPGGAPAEVLPDLEAETDQPVARRELRRQIAKLESDLIAYPDFAPAVEPQTAVGPKARVTTVAELERDRDVLVDRVAEARIASALTTEFQEMSRIRIEELAADPAAHRWERVSNEQIGEPGCRHWHSVPRYSFLGMLLGWWRVKVSSGCPLAGPREAAVARWSER